jgi:uncharacterized membrane protein YbhN (UPF0104 family)
MSLISWTLEATMYYIVARAFGIHEPFYVFLLLTAAANLAIAIVASQGGIGPFEIVVSRTIVAFGTSKHLADAYAIGLHAILLIPIVVIGLLLMWSMNLTLGDILKGEQATEAEAEAAAAEEDAGAARVVRSAKPAVEGNVRK